MTDFARRLSAIPAEIVRKARQSTWGCATEDEVLRTAEMLMRRVRGEDEPDQDRVCIWPGMTLRRYAADGVTV